MTHRPILIRDFFFYSVDSFTLTSSQSRPILCIFLVYIFIFFVCNVEDEETLKFSCFTNPMSSIMKYEDSYKVYCLWQIQENFQRYSTTHIHTVYNYRRDYDFHFLNIQIKIFIITPTKKKNSPLKNCCVCHCQYSWMKCKINGKSLVAI